MNLSINFGDSVSDKILMYRVEEYSFDMEPHINETNFHVLINNIDLTIDENDIVAEIRGYSPYKGWIKTNCKVPSSNKGKLRVETIKDPGFSYRIDDKEWPVYFNEKDGWVCIGCTNMSGDAVEFISGCVAVIYQKKLVSIWLKPKFSEDISI